jgi:hypothetical protein
MAPLRTDKGDFRDKVAAADPAAAPVDADSEAAGAPIPIAATEAANRRQATIAGAAVPKLDPNRAVSGDASLNRKSHLLVYLVAAVAVVLISIALLASTGKTP